MLHKLCSWDLYSRFKIRATLRLVAQRKPRSKYHERYLETQLRCDLTAAVMEALHNRWWVSRSQQGL